MQFLNFLYAFEWKKVEGPGGAIQWEPVDDESSNLVPDAFDKDKRHKPMMFTTDLALRYDPIYGKITKRFMENPEQFEDAFARAWFKLTHRDMGPRARYVGREVPKEVLSWQDPVPRGPRISNATAESIKKAILASGLSVSELVRTAWASAASYRGTDMRGGANGARVRLAPQKDWEVNNPRELSRVLSKLSKIKKQFGKVSMADVIVLGGAAAVEKAARDAGISVKVGFRSGRFSIAKNGIIYQVDATGRPKRKVGRDGQASFKVPRSHLKSKTFVLTIEPNNDRDPAPSDVHVMGGDYNRREASLSVSHGSSIGTDFQNAGGSFILAAPTGGEFNQGVWFVDPSRGEGSSPLKVNFV